MLGLKWFKWSGLYADTMEIISSHFNSHAIMNTGLHKSCLWFCSAIIPLWSSDLSMKLLTFPFNCHPKLGECCFDLGKCSGLHTVEYFFCQHMQIFKSWMWAWNIEGGKTVVPSRMGPILENCYLMVLARWERKKVLLVPRENAALMANLPKAMDRLSRGWTKAKSEIPCVNRSHAHGIYLYSVSVCM